MFAGWVVECEGSCLDVVGCWVSCRYCSACKVVSDGVGHWSPSSGVAAVAHRALSHGHCSCCCAEVGAGPSCEGVASAGWVGECECSGLDVVGCWVRCCNGSACEVVGHIICNRSPSSSVAAFANRALSNGYSSGCCSEVSAGPSCEGVTLASWIGECECSALYVVCSRVGCCNGSTCEVVSDGVGDGGEGGYVVEVVVDGSSFGVRILPTCVANKDFLNSRICSLRLIFHRQARQFIACIGSHRPCPVRVSQSVAIGLAHGLRLAISGSLAVDVHRTMSVHRVVQHK